MARTRTWWTDTGAMTSFAGSGARDVLSGSGLDVVGATLSRSLGAFHWLDGRDPLDGIQNAIYGLKVATTAAASDLAPANVNLHDWVWLRRYAVHNMISGSIQYVIANARDPAASWDTPVQRTFETGETLWFVWDTMAAPAETIRASWFARSLVLAPA